MRLVSTILLMLVPSMLGLWGAPAPPYPLSWFTEHFQLGLMKLPDGVSVELAPSSGPISAESVVISNTSPTELYVVGTYNLRDPVYAEIPIELAPGIGPLNKIVAGRAYKWDWDYDGSTNHSSFSWKPEDNHDRSDTVWLDSTLNNCLSSDEGTVLQLEPLNQYGGHRPADVDTPAAQSVLLPLVYGTRMLSIPLTISYSLNQDYQPEPSSLIPDDPDPGAVVGGVSFVLSLVGISIWLAILGIRKARQ